MDSAAFTVAFRVYALVRYCCAASGQADSLRCLVTISGISTLSSQGQRVPAYKMRKICRHSLQDAKGCKSNLAFFLQNSTLFNTPRHIFAAARRNSKPKPIFVPRGAKHKIRTKPNLAPRSAKYKPNPIRRNGPPTASLHFSSAGRRHECRRGKHECLRHGLKCRLSDQCVAHALLRAAPTFMWALVPQIR